MNRVTRLAGDIANDPATFIALGSVFMAAANGGIEGAWLNVGAAFVVASLRGYDSWTGRETGKPFGFLSLVNFGTAASIGAHAYMDHAHDPAILQKAMLTGTYAFSGIRSALLAWQKKQNVEPSNFSTDPQFYQGLACLGASGLNPIPVALSVLGIGRTLVKDNPDQETGFLRKHFTAARAYAAQYGVSTAMAASGNAVQGIGFALWSWGFSRFNRDLNDELGKNIKTGIKNALGKNHSPV